VSREISAASLSRTKAELVRTAPRRVGQRVEQATAWPFVESLIRKFWGKTST
jgi:hypothetical protein